MEETILHFLSRGLELFIPLTFLSLLISYLLFLPLTFFSKTKSIGLSLLLFSVRFALSPSLWAWGMTLTYLYLRSLTSIPYFAPAASLILLAIFFRKSLYITYLLPFAFFFFYGDWESLKWYGGSYLGLWGLNWSLFFSKQNTN